MTGVSPAALGRRRQSASFGSLRSFPIRSAAGPGHHCDNCHQTFLICRVVLMRLVLPSWNLISASMGTEPVSEYMASMTVR